MTARLLMRRHTAPFLSLCLAAGLAALVSLSAPGAALAAATVGEPAPAFTGTDTAGQTHQLADFRGKVVVLEWTNHECPYTAKHYNSGNMQALQKQATESGVIWLSVISSAEGRQGYVTAEEADALTVSRNAQPTAVLLDPEGTIGQAYDAKTTPHMYVINAEGMLVYAGAIDDDSSSRGDPKDADNHVRTALAEVAAGEPVSTPVTRPYGCSVKYR